MSVLTKKRLIENSVEDEFVDADEMISHWYGRDVRGGDYISGLRYREDLTQEELGIAIRVHQSNISAMERGERPIGKDIAKRLGEFFCCDWLKFMKS